MDDSSVTECDASSDGPLVSSILGVKGPLRFHPHHYTQRAHVCLRRVELSDDSSDDGEDDGVVYFSLFAHKRIDVKPGKEILLTVANGHFKDKPILLQGIRADFNESDEGEGAEDVVDVQKEKPASPAPAPVIPPKMRKGWTRKAEDASSVIPPGPRHIDAGVQVEPTSKSIAIQVQPKSMTSSVQTEEFKQSVSTQTWIDTTSTSVQVDVHRDESENSTVVFTNDDAEPSNRETVHLRERSLSPMELDSPSESPPDSPVFTPTSVPALIANLSPSILPEARIASDDDDSMQGVSIHKRDSPPPLLLDPVKPPSSPRPPAEDIIMTPQGSSSPGLSSLDISFKNESPDFSFSRDLPDVDTSPPAIVSNLATELPLLESLTSIPNPFVSAGFVTEFVGESRVSKEPEIESVKPKETSEHLLSQAEAMTDKSQPRGSFMPYEKPHQKRVEGLLETTKPRVPSPQSPFVSVKDVAAPHNTSSHSSLPPKRPASPLRPSPQLPTGPRSSLPVKQPPSQPRAFRKSLNAVASSSRQTLEGSGNRPIPSMPLSLRAREKSPAEPPPDPQSVAHISSGPVGNQLGIKASRHVLPPVAPAGPRALTGTSTKKKVVIGAGWQPNKGNQAVGRTPTSVSVTTPSTRLADIASYSSPSPSSTPPPPKLPPPQSPTPPPVPTVSIKWKRVAGHLGHLTSTCYQKESESPLTRISLEEATKRTVKEVFHSDRSRDNSFTDQHRQPVTKLDQTQAAKCEPQESRTGSFPTRIALPTLIAPNTDTPDRPTASTSNTTPVTTGHNTTTPRVRHPLPPKPVFAEVKRGVKRKSPGAPDDPERAEPMSQEAKRAFKWPTLLATHSVSLKGSGSLSVLGMALNGDGSCLAMYCADRTVRIWDNVKKSEMAKLDHNCSILSLCWVDDDRGVMILGQDGLVSKWVRTGYNDWTCAKVVDAGSDASNSAATCMAYRKDRLAVSFPQEGVKLWIWSKGAWKAQRSIQRQNASALTFTEDGSCLLGGTKDGVLWSCEVPNGTLRARAFLKTEVTRIDLSPVKNEVLVAHLGGIARLISLDGGKAEMTQFYSTEDTLLRSKGGFGAIFVARGQGVLFGSVRGCGLIWDLRRGSPPVYGLDHGNEEEAIEAAAECEMVGDGVGCIITGTRSGVLSWWSQPAYTPQGEGTNKRARMTL